MTRLCLTTVLAALAASAASAETRQLDAHEHGAGTLDIAIAGNIMEIALRAPGADIVGFEHSAESDADKAAVAEAIAALSDPAEYLTLPDAAECRATDTEAELESLGEEDHHDDDEHAAHDHEESEADDHAHEDEHDDHAEEHADDDNHDDHAEEHAHDDDHSDEDHADEAGHTEFHAHATFTCAAPDQIDSIAFPYFERFPGAQELEIQLVSDKGGFGAEVTRDDPVLDVKGKF
ncbi:ZrgA family zinc uptake protein [Tropicimonas marinistellae]|uniref:ZrgA family zinc uptake protein n=1 Tax=Tropicimonas marinistellae TaxID=1739787 RepID=UPI0008334F94|nr:DUF2796 domain-containing protein [Tropicimonas marinistellae]